MLSTGITAVSFAATINSSGSYNGTDVGGVDIFKTQGAQQGSPASELAWVNGFLNPGTDFTGAGKVETVSYYSTDQAGVFAFELTSEADYYLIKNATFVALFQNVADLGWGVFDSASLTAGMNLPSSGFTISHVTSFDDPSSPVTGGDPIPEPTSLLLISAGLLGLFGASRKKS